jgi:hypothetical protein
MIGQALHRIGAGQKTGHQMPVRATKMAVMPLDISRSEKSGEEGGMGGGDGQY